MNYMVVPGELIPGHPNLGIKDALAKKVKPNEVMPVQKK